MDHSSFTPNVNPVYRSETGSGTPHPWIYTHFDVVNGVSVVPNLISDNTGNLNSIHMNLELDSTVVGSASPGNAHIFMLIDNSNLLN